MTSIIGVKMNLSKITKYCLGEDVFQISLTETQYRKIVKAGGKSLVQGGIEYKIQSLVPFFMTLTKEGK